MDSEAKVEIQCNGDPLEIPRGSSLLTLLARMGRDPRSVAVEYNGRILGRAQFGEVVLQPGDRLEVVHFVQGGVGGPGGSSLARSESSRWKRRP